MGESESRQRSKNRKRQPKFIVLNNAAPMMYDGTPHYPQPPYGPPGLDHHRGPAHLPASINPATPMRCHLCASQAQREPVSCNSLMNNTMNCLFLPFEGLLRCTATGMRACVSSCYTAEQGCETIMTGCNTACERSLLNCEKGMYQKLGHHTAAGGCPIHGTKALEPLYPHAAYHPPPSVSMMQMGQPIHGAQSCYGGQMAPYTSSVFDPAYGGHYAGGRGHYG